MNDKTKNYVIAILLLLVLGISVGYATIGTNLRIEGTSKINSTSWNVKFHICRL